MKTTIFAICFALLISPIASAETLVVGIENQEFLPHYTIRNGNFTGFAAQVLLLFSKTSHHKLRIKAVAARHMLTKMRAGEIDLRYPDNPNWQAALKGNDKQAIYYSDNLVRYREGSLVVKEKSTLPVGQIKTIGIVRGREPVAYLGLLNARKVHAKEKSDLESLIKAALLGHVDVAYYNIDVAQFRLNAMGISNDLQFNDRLPYESDYYRLSTMRHKKIIDEFNRFLVQYQGDIEKLKLKYHLQ